MNNNKTIPPKTRNKYSPPFKDQALERAERKGVSR